MACCSFPVISTLDEAPKKGVGALLTLTDETKPGYVQLQFVSNRCVVTANDDIAQFSSLADSMKLHSNGIYYWKSGPCLPGCGYDTNYEMYTKDSGPAKTLCYPNFSYDHVYALRCNKWLTLANEWVSRQRNNDWPSKKKITDFQSFGFFVVPVGHPRSQENDLEWRVSFSFQERQLMHELTDIQYKCYVMLKLITHEFITGTVGKSITSYHCKTCIFYAIEQHPQSMWAAENLFQCIMKCLNLLLKWAERGCCPNYFIPSENMFDRHMTVDIRFKVVDVLKKLVTKGASFLKEIQTAKLGDYFVYRNRPFEIYEIEKQSFETISNQIYENEIQIIRHVLYARMQVLKHLNTILDEEEGELKTIRQIDSISDIAKAAERHDNIINWLNSIEYISIKSKADDREAIDLLLPYIHTSLACHVVAAALKCSRAADRSKTLGFSTAEFDQGMSSDLTSGRLKYITYMYICGHQRQCEQELVSLEEKYKLHTICISLCRDRTFLSNPNLQSKLERGGYCSKNILQNDVSTCVIFLPTEIEFIPDGLKFEMFRSAGTLPDSRIESTDFWFDWVAVDSNVYMYFVWYLLARKYDYPTKRRHLMIRKLALTVNDALDHKETAYNLLVWAFIQENWIPQALHYMAMSWNAIEGYSKNFRGMKKLYILHHNAVKWQMLLLLWQIWISKNRVLKKTMEVSFCFKCFSENVGRLRKCSSCKVVKYCSKNCFQMDWDSHKQICKLF